MYVEMGLLVMCADMVGFREMFIALPMLKRLVF